MGVPDVRSRSAKWLLKSQKLLWEDNRGGHSRKILKGWEFP